MWKGVMAVQMKVQGEIHCGRAGDSEGLSPQESPGIATCPASQPSHGCPQLEKLSSAWLLTMSGPKNAKLNPVV